MLSRINLPPHNLLSNLNNIEFNPGINFEKFEQIKVDLVSLWGANPSVLIPTPFEKQFIFDSIQKSFLNITQNKSSELKFHRQLEIIDHCIPSITEISQPESIDILLQSYFKILVSAPTKNLSQRSFKSFKLLFFKKLSFNSQLTTLAKMMTMYNNCSSLQVCSVFILKKLFEKSFVTNDYINMQGMLELFRPLIFTTKDSSIFLTSDEIFSSKTTIKGDSTEIPLRTDESKTFSNDAYLFFSKFELIMQILNLYYYLLMMDVRKRRFDLWNQQISCTDRDLIEPIAESCIRYHSELNNAESMLFQKMSADNNIIVTIFLNIVY